MISFSGLFKDTLSWNTVAKYIQSQPILIGLKSLRILKRTNQRLRLLDAQMEDIFFFNARNILGLAG